MSRRRHFGSIKRQRSGRYQASYEKTDGTRVTGPRTFTSQKLASDWLAEQQSKLARGDVDAVVSPLTFTEYAETYIETLQAVGRSPRTIVDYQSLLTNRLLPTFGHVKLRDITPDAVTRWYVQQGDKQASARAHAYGLLLSIMKQATIDRLIEFNPVHIKGASSVKRKSKITVLSAAEIDQLASLMPQRYRLMVHIAAWAGLRFGELTELRRSDIDVEQSTINVERAVIHTTQLGSHIKTPKSEAGVRELIMPPHLLDIVREHLRADISGGKDGLLFPATSDPTKHMRQSSLAKVFYRARAKMGRPDLRWHHLRHTGATTYAHTGATLKETMVFLGQSTPHAAMIYQHGADDVRKRELAARMTSIAKGGNA